MRSKESLELAIGKQDDLRYRWQLSRPSGRVIDDGVEAYIASCLAAAASTVDAGSWMTVSVDGVPGGRYAAVRMQVDSIEVAAEIAQAMLLQRGCGSSPRLRRSEDLLRSNASGLQL